MNDEQRARLYAGIDQDLALANELLDSMVAEVRENLDAGVDQAALVLTMSLTAERQAPGKVASALATALLRLARQDGAR